MIDLLESAKPACARFEEGSVRQCKELRRPLREVRKMLNELLPGTLKARKMFDDANKKKTAERLVSMEVRSE